MSNQRSIRKMISRTFVVGFLAIYVLFSVGVMKSTHFCMGREASVSFFTAESEKCACSIFATEKDSCCSDLQDLVKIDDDQTPAAYHLNVPHLYILEDLYTEQLIASRFSTDIIDRFDMAPSGPPPVPIFQMNCSFVFYDSEGSMTA